MAESLKQKRKASPSTGESAPETAGPSQPNQSRDSEHADKEVTPSTSQVSRSPSPLEIDEPPQQVGNQPAPDSEHAHVEVTPSTSQVSRSPSPLEIDEPPQQVGNQPAPDSEHAHVEARAAPEDVWNEFIEDLYPNLLGKTHFFPPLHFSRTSHDTEDIARHRVLVRKKPSASGQQLQQSAPPPAQVAGTVWVENDPNIQAALAQDSDERDDSAQQLCLQALSRIGNQVMMVISSLKFQNYLINHPNPRYAAAIAQLPSIQDPSIPQNIADGECDIVVIHRQYGLIIGELNSVGGHKPFQRETPDKQTQQIVKRITKAVKQLNNQETALRHLVSDLPRVRITKTLLLPNISSAQLQSALSASAPLLQALCRTMSLPVCVDLAVGHCLCKEDVQQPDIWWQTLHGSGQDQAMDPDVYRRLVARFCGPATTVDIPTAGLPRKVVRSWGEAVAETGLRFSSLTLTPRQVALLNTQPEPQYMYLHGPPGTGKTVVLLLKALQWVQQGHQVVIVSGKVASQAVTLLLQEQLRSMAGPAAAHVIQRLCYVFSEDDSDAPAAVTSLQQLISPGPVLVIWDEFDFRDTGYIPWLTEVHDRLPAVTVWTAGILTDGRPATDPLPSWLQVERLQEALRCPPSVTALLQQSDYISITLQYTDPQVAVATQGPPVQRWQHRGQPGHSGDRFWQCVTCADMVAQFIQQLRVGQPGQPLQYRDVWILYGGADSPSARDVIVRRLQQQHCHPVGVIPYPPSEADARELALAVTDQITVTEPWAVHGLERRVVIVLGSVRFFGFQGQSRCSSALYLID